MAVCEIVTIGTELLLGEIQDNKFKVYPPDPSVILGLIFTASRLSATTSNASPQPSKKL